MSIAHKLISTMPIVLNTGDVTIPSESEESEEEAEEKQDEGRGRSE
jgi:hypothetical protein